MSKRFRERHHEPPRWFPNPELAGALHRQTDVAAEVEKIRVLADECIANFTPGPESCDGGVYVGLGGLAYALWYAGTRPAMTAHRDHFLSEALRLIEFQLDVLRRDHARSRHDDCAFLLGMAGLHVVAALVHHSKGDAGRASSYVRRLQASAGILAPLGAQNEGSDEMFVGRAGFLLAALNLRLKAGAEVLSEGGRVEMVKATILSGRLGAAHFPAGSVHPPLVYAYHGRHYLGAAHGTSAILQALLCFPEALRKVDGRAAAEVRVAVDYFLDIQRPLGNFPSSMERIGDAARAEADELWHWCHGAPGVVHLLARAHRSYGGDKYLAAAKAAGDGIWARGLLRKGPGICHGVAGNAYAFLLLAQLEPAEPKHLQRARAFDAFLDSAVFREEARRPDCPWSLFEGWAGVLCFKADLLSPMDAEFPLFPTKAYA